MSKHPHLEHRDRHPAVLEAERLWIQYVREMDPLDRLERMEELNRIAQEERMSGLRERYPEASEDELKVRNFALRYGRELAIQFFNWDPDLEGW